jgi:hypothetical protein
MITFKNYQKMINKMAHILNGNIINLYLNHFYKYFNNEKSSFSKNIYLNQISLDFINYKKWKISKDFNINTSLYEIMSWSDELFYTILCIEYTFIDILEINPIYIKLINLNYLKFCYYLYFREKITDADFFVIMAKFFFRDLIINWKKYSNKNNFCCGTPQFKLCYKLKIKEKNDNNVYEIININQPVIFENDWAGHVIKDYRELLIINTLYKNEKVFDLILLNEKEWERIIDQHLSKYYTNFSDFNNQTI